MNDLKTNERRLLTASGLAADGETPARFDGPVTFTATPSGNVEIVQVDDTSAYVYGRFNGRAYINVEADADLDSGEQRHVGVQVIIDVINAEAEAATLEVELGDAEQV